MEDELVFCAMCQEEAEEEPYLVITYKPGKKCEQVEAGSSMFCSEKCWARAMIILGDDVRFCKIHLDSESTEEEAEEFNPL